MDLRNKIVKAPPGLIEFMYPTHRAVVHLTPNLRGERIIYRGTFKPRLKELLDSISSDYISLTGIPEADCRNRTILIRIINQKWKSRIKMKSQIKINNRINIKMTSILMSLPEESFLECVKYYWIVGELPPYVEEREVSIYQLFKAIAREDNLTLSQKYFTLLQDMPFRILESSVIRFLQRAQRAKEQNEISKGYQSILNSLSPKVKYNFQSAFKTYITRRKGRPELAFLSFLFDIRI